MLPLHWVLLKSSGFPDYELLSIPVITMLHDIRLMNVWTIPWLAMIFATAVLAQTTQPAPLDTTPTKPPAQPPPEPPSESDTSPTQPNHKTTPSAIPGLEDIQQETESLLRTLVVPPHPKSTQARLDHLAKQLARSVHTLTNPIAQLRARALQLRVYYAFASIAQDKAQLDYRLSQLRVAAWETKQIPVPDAQAIGDFGLLHADLFDINSSDNPLDDQQTRAIGKLQTFINDHLESPSSADVLSALKSASLALLALLDQQGLSNDARQVVNQLRSRLTPPDAQLAAILDNQYRYCETIGQQFQAHLRTDDGKPWSTDTYRGKPILLHFWAPWAKDSVKAFKQLAATRAQYQAYGLEILSISSLAVNAKKTGDNFVNNTVSLPVTRWPKVTLEPQDPDLFNILKISSLPRFVLIGPDGRVAAAGTTLAILDQVHPSKPSIPPAPDTTATPTDHPPPPDPTTLHDEAGLNPDEQPLP